MFLFYTTVNVSFLPCKISGPLMVNLVVKRLGEMKTIFEIW